MTLDEIDRLLAEKVMGWEFLHIGYFDTKECSHRQDELEDWLTTVKLESIGDYYIDVKTNFWIEKRDWHPSRNLEQAFMVDNKITQGGWKLSLHRKKDGFKAIYWHPERWDDAIAKAIKPEEAIARAAAEAMKDN